MAYTVTSKMTGVLSTRFGMRCSQGYIGSAPLTACYPNCLIDVKKRQMHLWCNLVTVGQ